MDEGEAIFLVAYDFQRLVSRARLNFATFNAIGIDIDIKLK